MHTTIRQGDEAPHPDGGTLRSTDSIAWAADVLRQHDMPSDEIRAVLAADDPELVHRYLELHRERLEERLADQRLTLARLEQLLAGAEPAARRDRNTSSGGRLAEIVSRS